MARKKVELTPEIKKAIGDPQISAIDSGELLKHLIERMGGPAGLASRIVEELGAAPIGGITRQRTLEMIQRLIINNTNNDIGRVKNPSDMETEELESVVEHYLTRLNAKSNAAPKDQTLPGSPPAA